MADLIVNELGYFIQQNVSKNYIRIGLPQTDSTITNTIESTRNRVIELSNAELMTILGVVTMMFEKEYREVEE